MCDANVRCHPLKKLYVTPLLNAIKNQKQVRFGGCWWGPRAEKVSGKSRPWAGEGGGRGDLAKGERDGIFEKRARRAFSVVLSTMTE